MKGYVSVVAVLLVLIGASLVSLFFMQSASLTGRAMLIANKELESRKLVARYLEVASAKISFIDKNNGIVNLSIFFHNSAAAPIFYNAIGVYLYDGYKLTDHTDITSLSSPCTGEYIPSGAVCGFDVNLFYDTNGDLSKARVRLLINGYTIYADPVVREWPGVKRYYKSCSSCSECTTLLGSDNVYLIVEPIDTSGDCITVSSEGAHIICRDYIEGDGTGTGILVEANNVTIERCRISGFEKGIVLNNVKNTEISSVTLNNDYDLVLLADSPEFCDQSSISASGSDGKIVYVEGGSSTGGLSFQGLWLYNVSNATFSNLSLSHMSPALLVCNSSGVTVQSSTISSSDIGISLINDNNTFLNDINVQSDVTYGLESYNSSDSLLSFVTLSSINGALFVSPDDASVNEFNVS